MSIAAPTDAVAIADTAFAPTRPVLAAREAELAANLHYLVAQARTPVVSTVFNGDQSAGGGIQPYVVGAATASQPQAVWAVPQVAGPWTHWEIRARVENTSGTDAGKVRITRASDGTYTEITVAASTAQWGSVTGTLAIDTAVAIETLRLYPLNGATGEVRVHSIEIRPAPLSSIAASTWSIDGVAFKPFDSTEVADDAPLSVAFRRRLHQSLEAVRRSRLDAIVGWSDAALYRVAAYQQTTTPYAEAFRVPFQAPPHRSRLRWALFGFATTGTGYVRLSTRYSRSAGVADVEKQLAVGWSSPFSAGLLKYSDSGAAAVQCAPGQPDELLVEVKGTNATIMGLTAWCVDT